MTEVVERYVEQLTTTVETLRRRGIAYYDGVFYIGNKIVTAAERLKEVAEPIAYDVKDYTTAAITVDEPVYNMKKETRNNTVEMYLCISVLMLGLSSGQLAGMFVLAPLLEFVFDRYVEVGTLFLLPVYVYLALKKNAAMDDTERRTTLFGAALLIGILTGHLIGQSIAFIAPSTFFIPPLALALLIDNELLVTPLTAMDRLTFFYVGGAFSVLICTLAAIVPLGQFSFAVFVFSSLHVAFLCGHIQVFLRLINEKISNVGESQFAYLIGVLLIQLLFTGIFGSVPKEEVKTDTINSPNVAQ